MDDAFDGLGPLGTYADEDLRAWAAAGSRPRRFDDALSALARARLLSSAVGGSFGPSVERGMAAEEAGAALALAGHGADDWGQLRAKRLALRPYAAEGPSCLLGTVVRAALAHDERRLASQARPERPTPGPRSAPPRGGSFWPMAPAASRVR